MARVRASRQHQATSWRCESLSGQPVAVAQAPVAVAQAGVGDGAQQPRVERAQLVVRRLVGPAAEEDRDARAPALELAVVVEARALAASTSTTAAARACAGANVAAARGSSWFSMNRSRRSW